MLDMTFGLGHSPDAVVDRYVYIPQGLEAYVRVPAVSATVDEAAVAGVAAAQQVGAYVYNVSVGAGVRQAVITAEVV